jgi:hypothetical protein
VKTLTIRKQIEAAVKGGDWRLLTITCDNSRAPREAWQNYSYCLKRFMIYLQRANGKRSYISVLEHQNTRCYPHSHILIEGNLDAKTLHSIVTSCGFGGVLQLETVESSGVGNYVAKYLTKKWTDKQAETYRREFGLRYVRSSRDIKLTHRLTTGEDIHAITRNQLLAEWKAMNALPDGVDWNTRAQVSEITRSSVTRRYMTDVIPPRKEAAAQYVTEAA